MAKKQSTIGTMMSLELSRHTMRQNANARSVEIRKVKRAAKARAKAIGSVWDDE